MRIRIVAMILVLAFGSACASKDDTRILCAQIGALTGGVTGGAVAGTHETGSQFGKVAAGAAGGAILGGLAGYFICKWLTPDPPPPPPPAPKAVPPPPPPVIAEKIVLRGVNFDFDKSAIRSDASVILDEAARILGENANVNVRVEGHTDWTGPDAYNQGLSERRADSVKSYLATKGISAGRLTTVGLGESRPMASNETREGRALNRRVELHVLE